MLVGLATSARGPDGHPIFAGASPDTRAPGGWGPEDKMEIGILIWGRSSHVEQRELTLSLLTIADVQARSFQVPRAAHRGRLTSVAFGVRALQLVWGLNCQQGHIEVSEGCQKFPVAGKRA